LLKAEDYHNEEENEILLLKELPLKTAEHQSKHIMKKSPVKYK